MLAPQTITATRRPREPLARAGRSRRGGGRGPRRLHRQLGRDEQQLHGPPQRVVVHEHEVVHVAAAQARSCRARRAARPGCRRWCAPRRSPAASRRRSCGACCRRPRAPRRRRGSRGRAASPPPPRPRTGRPPPMGTITASRGPACSHELEAQGGGAQRGERPLERMHERAALLASRSACTRSKADARRPPARPRRPARGSASTRKGLAVFGMTTLAVVPSTPAA